MIHFCADELLAIMVTLPWIGLGFRWLRAKLRGKHCDRCDDS